MLPVAANPTTLDSGIAVVKHLANDGYEPHSRQSKMVSPQGHQETGVGAQADVVSDKGKEANAQDHDDKDSVTAHAAKKLKQQEGLGIDINKALHEDDGLASPPAAAGDGKGPSPHLPLSLEIKKRELEIDAEMLELERQRVRWANASRRKDVELEKMRLENDRMKLDNERLWVQLKHRERELGVKSKRGLGQV